MVDRSGKINAVPFLKIAVRFGLWFYCSRIRFRVTPQKGPVILACNHPNSFFDALLVGSHYTYPVHFLARGDVFRKPGVARLLRRMNMIPIHRLSEGRAGLGQNEESFQECLSVLQNGGTVLIFSEGLCKNEWTLRPLKKGTARLAYAGWKEKGLTDLVVKPVAFSYSSFRRLPLAVEVTEVVPICNNAIDDNDAAVFYRQFNSLLQESLQNGLLSERSMNETRGKKVAIKILLSLPAFIGWLTQKPLFTGLKKFAERQTAGTVFYHSVLFGLLLMIYPIFLLMVTGLFVFITKAIYGWFLLLILPFTAWCYKEWKA